MVFEVAIGKNLETAPRRRLLDGKNPLRELQSPVLVENVE